VAQYNRYTSPWSPLIAARIRETAATYSLVHSLTLTEFTLMPRTGAGPHRDDPSTASATFPRKRIVNYFTSRRKCASARGQGTGILSCREARSLADGGFRSAVSIGREGRALDAIIVLKCSGPLLSKKES
jgi:hypothetical protein